MKVRNLLLPVALLAASSVGHVLAQSSTDADDNAVTSGSELPADGPASTLPQGVLATVNGVEITQRTLDTVRTQIEAQGEDSDPQRILTELINLELLTQQAEAIELDKNSDIKAAIRLQYTQTMANAWLARMSQDVEISESDLRAEYERQTAQLENDEFRASHILVETEDAAKEVISELANGAEFATLAQEHSIDGASDDGGDLGWVPANVMVPEFSAAVAEMEVGETSQTPVKSDFGYHVIKLVELRNGATPDYESVKPGLRNLVLRDALATRVEELKANSDIQR